MSAPPVIDLALKLKAQLFCGEAIAMGPGKADLMEAIAREGSISAAGRALGISYRRCWLMVDEVNRCWRTPLVATTTKGATLTAAGEEVLAAYRGLQARLRAAAAGSAEQAALAGALRDVPA